MPTLVWEYLLKLIADCDIDRPRRGRVNKRVVKVKMSSYHRKKAEDKSQERDFAKELTILFPPGFDLKKILEIVKDEWNQTKQKKPRKYKTEEITLRPAA